MSGTGMHKWNPPARSCVATIAAAILLACAHPVRAQQVSVQAAVEKQDLFLGEAIIFQVQVEGNDSPGKPDLSALTDFSVQEAGGGPNNSYSEITVNGQTTRNERKAYVFQYRLAPRRSGDVVIPPVTVDVAGQRFTTPPIPLRVKEPTETADFKFRQRLTKTKCYVGEPVTLYLTWYKGGEVRGVQFGVPVLEDGNFNFAEASTAGAPGHTRYRIPIPGGETIGVEGRARLGDRDYMTITFGRVLIPKKAGTFEIPQAVAMCEVLTGYRESGSPMDGFFGGSFPDGLFSRRQGVYTPVPVPSNPLKLEVMDLPAQGRPSNFSGLVGRYSVEASAAPREVNVGDPITLTVSVSGSDGLELVNLPPLQQQEALARDFKIPVEMAPGKSDGAQKVFTQTIRAMRPGVAEIPPVELPYFDSQAGEYRVAKSKPIPLTVRETRVITAIDAEGRDVTPAGSALEAWSKGIAHNYEGAAVLVNQRCGPAVWLRSPAWLSVLVLPPFAYLAVLIPTATVRRRRADPLSLRSKQAYGALRRSLRALRKERGPGALHAAVLEAIRAYLGGRLKMPAAALTFADVSARLAQGGVDAETISGLGRVFERCEAGSYAGGAAGADDADRLVDDTLAVATRVERALKRGA